MSEYPKVGFHDPLEAAKRVDDVIERLYHCKCSPSNGSTNRRELSCLEDVYKMFMKAWEEEKDK